MPFALVSAGVAGNIFAGLAAQSVALPAVPNAGMKAEDLIGYRIWRLKNGHLWSFSADYAWMPGGVSEGEPGDHDAAGIWAFKAKRRAFQKAVEIGTGYVWGSVRLWGQVVEHKEGYRASKARIISIDGATADISRAVLAGLRKLYLNDVGLGRPGIMTRVMTKLRTKKKEQPNDDAE